MQQLSTRKSEAIPGSMLQKLMAGLCAILLVFVLPGCEKIVGEGPVVTETRQVPAFQGVKVHLPAEVIYTKGPDCTLELQGQRNILDEIRTRVNDNILSIDFRHDANIRRHEPIVIRITAPQASLLELHGAGKIEVNGSFDPATVRLYISGSATIDAENFQSNKIEAGISGSGRIIVRGGAANEGRATISGSAYIDMADVQVKDAYTTISGSGNIRIHATDYLKANISGSGSVFYKGTPTIQSSISGSGTVVKM
jgi:hypothetical protein